MGVPKIGGISHFYQIGQLGKGGLGETMKEKIGGKTEEEMKGGQKGV